jgi:glucan phosphorylase
LSAVEYYLTEDKREEVVNKIILTFPTISTKYTTTKSRDIILNINCADLNISLLYYINMASMEENEVLKKENEELRNKVLELEEKLKKYTNGDNHKRYYEKNKEQIKEAGSNYLKKLKAENPEKLKEYRQRAYQKRKGKIVKEETIEN